MPYTTGSKLQKLIQEADDEMTAKYEAKTRIESKNMTQNTLGAHRGGMMILTVWGKKVEALGKAKRKTSKAGPGRKDQLNLDGPKIRIFERQKARQKIKGLSRQGQMEG